TPAGMLAPLVAIGPTVHHAWQRFAGKVWIASILVTKGFRTLSGKRVDGVGSTVGWVCLPDRYQGAGAATGITFLLEYSFPVVVVVLFGKVETGAQTAAGAVLPQVRVLENRGSRKSKTRKAVHNRPIRAQVLHVINSGGAKPCGNAMG
ncbi:MAG TPA: hypothetical protein VJS11_08460, partial [Acidobacteriaceae bacterium]|nr:hypothetical protein [Acidobacteriaceae bacterium]